MEETKTEKYHFRPLLCFPSESKFFLFVLLPGQKVFISIVHPMKALPSVELRKAQSEESIKIEFNGKTLIARGGGNSKLKSTLGIFILGHWSGVH